MSLLPFFRRGLADSEIEAEMRAHIDLRTEENIANGMDPEEARFAAMRQFGWAESLKEKCRDQRDGWVSRQLSQVAQDLRYAARALRKNPVFTAVAVLTLALGVGANTAIFSLLDAVLLRRLPVRNPEEWVILSWVGKDWPKGVKSISVSAGSMGQDKLGRMHAPSFSYAIYERLAQDTNVLSSVVGLFNLRGASVTVRGQAEVTDGELVTGQFFSGLGVSAVLGRTLEPGDDRPGAPPVVVISDRMWRERFSSAADIIGRPVSINNIIFDIVGVAAPGFRGVRPGAQVGFWAPLRSAVSVAQVSPGHFTDASAWWLGLMGRLRPGVDARQAAAILTTMVDDQAAAGLEAKPTAAEMPKVEIATGANGLDELRREFSEKLSVLSVVVGIVLLICCANVAGLLVARAAARGREICVRLAIGASRGRIVRQLVTEVMFLTFLGGIVGLLFGVWGSRILLLIAAPPGQSVPIEPRLDFPVLAFACAVSLVAALLFGLTPAWRAARADLASELRGSGGAVSSSSRPRLRFRKALVISQTALAVLLLGGAGLLIRTLINLENQPVGFSADQVILFNLEPHQQGYDGARLLDFYDELLRRLRAIPGVEAASLANHSPLSEGGATSNGFEAEGSPPETQSRISVHVDTVGQDFFRTMGISLLSGRAFGAEDTLKSFPVVVINQTMAKQFFGDNSPVGRVLSRGPKGASKLTVVGVVQDARYYSLTEKQPSILYLPYSQEPGGVAGGTGIEVRAAGNLSSLMPAIREAVAGLEPNMPLRDIRTQTQQVGRVLAQPRLFARLVSVFGGLALALVCIGLYGLMAFAIAQRTRELGVRIALGATRRSVVRMVIAEGFLLVAPGVASGLAAILAANRLFGHFLFGVGPADPATFLSVAGLLSGVAFVASYIPAKRAAMVDPMTALRAE